MSRKLVLVAFALAMALPSAARAADKAEVRDGDVVVVYGDSITEQNLYSAYIETFLITRLVDCDFKVYNFGWGGDTADGGNRRFARDVMPVGPTLVFVNFGMNDGRYRAFDQGIYDWYMNSQRALAATIKDAGAREVLCTTSPVEMSGHHYNPTLLRMADGVKGLAGELGLVSADIMHPMLEDLKEHEQLMPGHRLIPDSVHPGPAGHILMAYYVLRAVDTPRVVAEIEIDGDRAECLGGDASVRNFRREGGMIEFDLTLPFIPFYVPPEARDGLKFVPFEEDLNRFTLKVADWRGTKPCMVVVDGAEGASFGRRELAEGVDLALVDKATWAVQGREVWEAAQFRWRRHFDAWRVAGLQAPAIAKKSASYEAMIRASKDFVAEMGAFMKETAEPRTYRVRLAATTEISLPKVYLSPLYPWQAGSDKRYAPETDPEGVEWTSRALDGTGFVDFTKVFPDPTNCTIFARFVLEAAEACSVGFAFGSDDGVTLFANGKQVYENQQMRGYSPGEDNAEVELRAGRNEIMFQITQGAGGFSFGAKARVQGQAEVTAVEP